LTIVDGCKSGFVIVKSPIDRGFNDFNFDGCKNKFATVKNIRFALLTIVKVTAADDCKKIFVIVKAPIDKDLDDCNDDGCKWPLYPSKPASIKTIDRCKCLPPTGETIRCNRQPLGR